MKTLELERKNQLLNLKNMRLERNYQFLNYQFFKKIILYLITLIKFNKKMSI